MFDDTKARGSTVFTLSSTIEAYFIKIGSVKAMQASYYPRPIIKAIHLLL
jgi:hypothetical protein